MSSSIRVEKICIHCKASFIARTTVTNYCSSNCASRAYKQRVRQNKIRVVNEQVDQLKKAPIDLLQQKDYLSVKEATLLFGVSSRTIFRLLKSGKVSCAKLGSRTILRKLDFEALFSFKPIEAVIDTELKPVETYTVSEIKEKFNIKYGRLNAIIRERKIPHELIRGRLHVSKTHIDRYFRVRRMDVSSINSWYTVDEIVEQFGLRKSQVYSMVHDYKVPKSREGCFIKVSKEHFNQIISNKR